MADDHTPRLSYDNLLRRLAIGFEALYDKVQEIQSRNAQLEQQIKEIQSQNRGIQIKDVQDVRINHQAYVEDEQDLCDSSPTTDSQHILNVNDGDLSGQPLDSAQVDTNSIGKVHGSSDYNEERIQDGLEACRALRTAKRNGTLPGDAPGAETVLERVSETIEGPVIEQDFTTHGTQGDLKCPFATVMALRKLQSSASALSGHQRPGSLPTPPEMQESFIQDPIAAEFHASDFGSPPPSVQGSASKCPIRFLDQHSPEEVAKYFENHKHEIPRSHEICVKRYQTNEESIRELDAKYGNLVSMIQGLGLKHKPMLPTKEEEEAALLERQSMKEVEKWAENCTEGADAATSENAVASEGRVSHFDRPLNEIRVGESPSRPWGIRVPYAELLALSSNPAEDEAPDIIQSIENDSHAEQMPPKEKSPAPAGKCPFGKSTGWGTALSSDEDSSNVYVRRSKGKEVKELIPIAQPDIPEQMVPVVEKPIVSSMIFHGPVFIGYPADQAAIFLQNMAKASKT